MRRATPKREMRMQGMNWIRPEKRLAIYLRDGLACCYCQATIEDGIRLTLDHLKPYSKDGSNDPTNLVACCSRCNSSRGNRSWIKFAVVVAEYLNHGIKPENIVRHISSTRRRALDLMAAKQLIARRGGFTAALHA